MWNCGSYLNLVSSEQSFYLLGGFFGGGGVGGSERYLKMSKSISINSISKIYCDFQKASKSPHNIRTYLMIASKWGYEEIKWNTCWYSAVTVNRIFQGLKWRLILHHKTLVLCPKCFSENYLAVCDNGILGNGCWKKKNMFIYSFFPSELWEASINGHFFSGGGGGWEVGGGCMHDV